MAKKAAKKVVKKTVKKTAAKAASKPVKLLSGGNPQIAKGDGDESVRAYLDAMPGWKKAIGDQLDELIVKAVPSVEKCVKWNSPFYGVSGKGWFISFHCFTKYVKVTFFKGASLTPLPPGVSKTPEVRYLDLYENEPLNKKQLTAWIKQASKIPGWLT